MDKKSFCWLWIGGSGIGALLGVLLALALFPTAAIARNPTGQLGAHLLGFALAIGVLMALFQWLILRYALQRDKTEKTPGLLLWIPTTIAGVALMVLPLWWVDAAFFFILPFLSFVPMLPGAVLLGFSQRTLLHRFSARFEKIQWVFSTVLGASIGSAVGCSLMVYVIPPGVFWK